MACASAPAGWPGRLRGFQAKMSKCAQAPVGANRCRKSAAVTEPGLCPAVRVVLDLRDVAVERIGVGFPERHAPDGVAHRPGRGLDLARERLVVGVERRQLRPERHPRRPGERRQVDGQGRLQLPGPRQRIGQDQPTLGVGIADLDGEPLARGEDVARPHGVAGDGVLHHRGQHRQAHRQLGGHDPPAKRQGMGRTAHVLLHLPHAGGRLDVEAAGVEHHALAHQADQGLPRLAPADLDHPGAPRQVGGATHRVDRRIVGLQQRIAGDDADRRPMLLGDLAGDGLDLQGAHVVGGGVDHVAGERAGVRDLADFGQVGALGQQLGAFAGVGLVAVEFVAPEREGQRDLVGGHAPGRAGDAVDSGGQLGGERAERHGIAALAQAEQDMGEAPLGAGDQQHLAGLALEVGDRGEGLGAGGHAVQRRAGLALGERVDRDDRAFGGVEDHIGHGALFGRRGDQPSPRRIRARPATGLEVRRQG